VAGLKNGESDGKQKNSSWGVGVTHNAGTDRRLSNFSSSKKTGTFSSFPVRALLPSRQACSGRSRIRPAAPGTLVSKTSSSAAKVMKAAKEEAVLYDRRAMRLWALRRWKILRHDASAGKYPGRKARADLQFGEAPAWNGAAGGSLLKEGLAEG